MLARIFNARKPPVQLWCRCISSSALPPLPPLEAWRSEFSVASNHSRVFLQNEKLADRLAHAFLSEHGSDSKGELGENSAADGEGKVVIEAFPGPGTLTRSLLKLPASKVKKLIVLENIEEYLKYLQPLEACDPRLTVVPLSGFIWTTYKDIEARGLLDDVIKKTFADEKPNLHFISHIPNSVHGDQLIAQFWRLIPERAWLFRYGRVPMSLIMNDILCKRLVATPSTKTYCKLSVIAAAASHIEHALPLEELTPYMDHFFPPTGLPGDSRRSNYAIGSPLAAITVNPRADSVIRHGLLDKWDYCLRRLFVLKSTPLKRAISSMAPGAVNLLPKISNPDLPESQRIDTSKKIRELTVNDWAVLVKAFDEWPFAPEDLNISDSLYQDIERD